MPLTDDQRAMLQLLLEGGQSYADIASLLGIEVAEARSRARAALREIGGTDPDAEVGLTDYLLGQADPIGRADAIRHLQNDAGANELARRLAAQLRLLAPKAELPELPEPRGGRVGTAVRLPGAPGPAPTAPGQAPEPLPARLAKLPSRLGGGLGTLTRRQSQLYVGLGTGVLLIVIVVLAIAGVFSGDDGGGEDGDSATTPTDAEELTIVELGALDGSQAEGQAVFARAGDQPVLQINLSGLEPAGRDQNYIVWLYNSSRLAFPIARDRASEEGDLTGAAPIPQEIVPLLPQFGCVDVSLASNQETQRALGAAVQGRTLPRHSGVSVLRGEIPRDGTDAATGADANCAEAAAAAAAGEAGGVTGTTPTTTAP